MSNKHIKLVGRMRAIYNLITFIFGLIELTQAILRITLPIFCILLTIAIPTFAIQSIYASIPGQVIYSNDGIQIISSILLVPLVYWWIRSTMIRCIPDDSRRRHMLYSLMILSAISVVLLPCILFVTIGTVGCWDAAIAITVSAVMLLYCDSSVNPSKDKKKAVTTT